MRFSYDLWCQKTEEAVVLNRPEGVAHMPDPKLFVSYSWTNPDHEDWVLQLAVDLRQSGVDVILDKWDLREGQDTNVFMEKMVTDPEIKKVVLICDKAYVEKTNGRKGGVGTEAQIISAEVYQKQDQQKFVALVTERTDDGKACLPVYYQSRIYIDFTDPSRFSESFEQLLRWIYDQPLYKKPEIGQKPAFLSENEDSITLATNVPFRRAVEAIRNDRNHAVPATIEYFEVLARELERFRLSSGLDPFDEHVLKSVELFLPYRNEAIEMFDTLALYHDTQEMRSAVHRLFEKLIPYLTCPPQITTYREWDFDNFRFIIYELFLYAIACYLKHERFQFANFLMSNDYYVPGNSTYGRDVMVPFMVFNPELRSLEYRNQRLNLRRMSLAADILLERCKGHGVEFRHLMQADFTLALRDRFVADDRLWTWWPATLVFGSRAHGPFEIYARSRSAAYFERTKLLLGIGNKDELEAKLEAWDDGFMRNYGVKSWLGLKDLASKP
jgi:hypothetical protein